MPHPSKREFEAAPENRRDLEAWVRRRLRLSGAIESQLLAAIDTVLARQERLWRDSKQDAIRALSAGFADKLAAATAELQARDATVSTIATYFEGLIADLTDRTQRDPKTQLMNFARFTEQLESFLAFEQRGPWCAVGLVDITQFKWYNDTLGHATGDQLIVRVAQLLREQVRSQDVLARDRSGPPNRELHARFGGDEFCFLIPHLADDRTAYAIAERFREAVRRFDWALEDSRLTLKPVEVDVGVVCLRLGPIAERRAAARDVADALIRRADELMYDAKHQADGHIRFRRARLEQGELVDIDNQPEPIRG